MAGPLTVHGVNTELGLFADVHSFMATMSTQVETIKQEVSRNDEANSGEIEQLQKELEKERLERRNALNALRYEFEGFVHKKIDKVLDEVEDMKRREAVNDKVQQSFIDDLVEDVAKLKENLLEVRTAWTKVCKSLVEPEGKQYGPPAGAASSQAAAPLKGVQPPAYTPAPAAEERSTLKVQITSAKGLRGADLGVLHRSSDPFCVCTIVGRPETKLKTKIIKRCLEPAWNFEGELAGCRVGDVIEFAVYDHDAVSVDDLLGKATLKYEDFAASGFAGEVPLAESGAEAATLQVSVRWLGK